MKRPGYLSGLVMVMAMIFAPVICAADAQPDCDMPVHSLDEIRGAIKGKAARELYDRNMNIIRYDGFGMKLPDGFTKEFLVQKLAPGQDPALAVLVGVKAWPLHPRSYVAIVCLAATASGVTKFDDGNCGNLTEGNNPRVWLGVFEKNGSGTPMLVTRTPVPVDMPTRWDSANLNGPDALDDSKSGAIMPEKWIRFDLAPYQLQPDDYAFGVRAGWSESHAGGGNEYEALYLFQIDGHSLRIVFVQPMAFFTDMAGDWYPDHTRDHYIDSGGNSLIVLPGQTNGFHDLQLRQQSGKWKKTFRWSPTKQFYTAADSSR